MSKTIPLTSEPCEILGWDTVFFGYPIARVQGQTLTKSGVEFIDEWCHQNHVACLYFLARADDQNTANLAEENGFRLVDTRITLARNISRIEEFPDEDSPTVIRLARQEDISALQTIASSSHQDSRFYYDPNFDRKSCHRLYAKWIEDSINGYADAVLVVHQQGNDPVGYITCHLDVDLAQGRIGLVAIAQQVRGQRTGTRMVIRGLDWFSRHNAGNVIVVTQSRNHPALRLYQRCGFTTQNIEHWYHKWYQTNNVT